MERVNGHLPEWRNQTRIALANGGSLHVSYPDSFYLPQAKDIVNPACRLSFRQLLPPNFIGDSELSALKSLSFLEQAPKNIPTSDGLRSIMKYDRKNGELEIYLDPIADIVQEFSGDKIKDSKGKDFWWVNWIKSVMKSKQANEYYQKPGSSKRNKSAELVEKLINDLILTQSAISHLNFNEQQFRRYISENEALIGHLYAAGIFITLVAINNRMLIDTKILFLLGVAGFSEIISRKINQFLQSLKVNRIKKRLERDLYSSGGPFVILSEVV